MIREEVEDIILTDKNLKIEKENELTAGLRPDGNKIGKYRNPEYAEYKNMLNQKAGFGNVDLIYTGAFVEGLFPYQKRPSIYTFSYTVNYGSELIEKYGTDILGINKETFLELQKKVYAKQLVSFIKKQLGQ